MDTILDETAIENLRVDKKKKKKCITNTCDQITELINRFEAQDVSQSFFVSGNFGNDSKERLLAIKNALNDYLDIVSGDGQLIQQTNIFLDEQMQRIKRNL